MPDVRRTLACDLPRPAAALPALAPLLRRKRRTNYA